MRVWKRLPDGKLVDALLPEYVGDHVYVYGINDSVLPFVARKALANRKRNAYDDCVVYDRFGWRYAMESEVFRDNPAFIAFQKAISEDY